MEVMDIIANKVMCRNLNLAIQSAKTTTTVVCLDVFDFQLSGREEYTSLRTRQFA